MLRHWRSLARRDRPWPTPMRPISTLADAVRREATSADAPAVELGGRLTPRRRRPCRPTSTTSPKTNSTPCCNNSSPAKPMRAATDTTAKFAGSHRCHLRRGEAGPARPAHPGRWEEARPGANWTRGRRDGRSASIAGSRSHGRADSSRSGRGLGRESVRQPLLRRTRTAGPKRLAGHGSPSQGSPARQGVSSAIFVERSIDMIVGLLERAQGGRDICPARPCRSSSADRLAVHPRGCSTVAGRPEPPGALAPIALPTEPRPDCVLLDEKSVGTRVAPIAERPADCR